MGSMERELARRQARLRQDMEKSTAGGVDLQQFKGGDRAEQQKVADRMLQQGGWLCSCGSRFTTEAIAAVGQTLGRFPATRMTPQGPRVVTEDGAQTITQTFCSKRCPDYQDALKNGLDVPEGSGMVRPPIVAIRYLPRTEWLDTPEDDHADMRGPVPNSILLRP